MNRKYLLTITTALWCLPRGTCLNCSSIVPRCVDCTYGQNQVFCRSCEEGYVVSQYNQCVTTVTCMRCQDECDSTGRCFGDCKPGWTGTKCEYECSYACETCIFQDECLSCKDGFYTRTCTISCNKNCQSGSSPMCRFGDGYCSNGCSKGFWGDHCENNCNNDCLDITTASELCHRNGSCFYGCRAGYMGSDCSLVFSVSASQISITTTIRTSTAKIEDVTTSGTTSLTQTKAVVNATEANLQTLSDCCINCRGSPGPAIGGSIAGGFVLGALAAAVVFYLRERSLQKQKDRTQSKNMYYDVSISASHEERSQSDTGGHPKSKDVELASVSRHSEATLYEKLSEQNKGYIYDDLDQSVKNEINQEVGKFKSNVEYYNN